MTREEAVKELVCLRNDYWDDDGYGHETKQYENTVCALDMAIVALRQNESAEEWYKLFVKILELEQEPKTGYWIPLGNYDYYGNENSYKCSECGDIDTYPDNFCPNCGAKMEGRRQVRENELAL